MMKTLGNVLASASILSLAAITGCYDTNVDTDTSSLASGSGAGDGGGGNGASGGDVHGGRNAKVRVAHLAPDAPAVDFCLRAAGGAWTGPVLESLGGKNGLSYPNVTKYLEVDESTYTMRLVDPAATDCTKSLAGLPDIADIKVMADEFYTLAAIGELAAGAKNAFQVKVYKDDGVPSAGMIKVRVVHASPDAPNLECGLGKGENFLGIWPNVAYSMEGLAFGNVRYAEYFPLTGATISVREAEMSTDLFTVEPVYIPAGAIVTGWAIGNFDGMPRPLEVLRCFDTEVDGILTKCSIVA